jgi:hypothetical protein
VRTAIVEREGEDSYSEERKVRTAIVEREGEDSYSGEGR